MNKTHIPATAYPTSALTAPAKANFRSVVFLYFVLKGCEIILHTYHSLCCVYPIHSISFCQSIQTCVSFFVSLCRWIEIAAVLVLSLYRISVCHSHIDGIGWSNIYYCVACNIFVRTCMFMYGLIVSIHLSINLCVYLNRSVLHAYEQDIIAMRIDTLRMFMDMNSIILHTTIWNSCILISKSEIDITSHDDANNHTEQSKCTRKNLHNQNFHK